MKKMAKCLVAAALLSIACVLPYSGTASAAIATATCTYSGTYDEVADAGKFSFTCTSDPSGTCKGTGTASGGSFSGTCSGSSTFGKVNCTVSGSYTVDTAANTAKLNGTYSCKAGAISCSGTQSGSGSYTNAGKFKGTTSGSC